MSVLRVESYEASVFSDVDGPGTYYIVPEDEYKDDQAVAAFMVVAKDEERQRIAAKVREHAEWWANEAADLDSPAVQGYLEACADFETIIEEGTE